MATKITSEKIVQINELYAKNHNYSATAREIGVAPSTVKKYVDPNYIPKANLVITHVDIDKVRAQVESFTLNLKEIEKDSCLNLSEEEKNEIQQLWRELLV